MAEDPCSACSKAAPRPVLICMDCIEGVDCDGALSRTIYCEMACKTADKKKHNKHCRNSNARKIIFRASEIIQAAFYKWREATFDRKVVNVWKDADDGKLHMSIPFNNPAELLHTIPSRPFLDSSDQKAILTDLACGDVHLAMFHLMKKLLSKHISEINECLVQVDKAHWYIERHFTDMRGEVDTRDFPHQIVTFKAKDNEEYVLDVAGAQYRQYRPLVKYQEYFDAYVSKVNAYWPHGTYLTNQEQRVSGLHDSEILATEDLRVAQINLQVTECFNEAVQKWEKKNKKAINTILASPRADYEKDRVSFLVATALAMRAYITDWKQTGCKLKLRGSKHCFSDLNTKVGDGIAFREVSLRDLPPPSSGKCVVTDKYIAVEVRADPERASYYVQMFEENGRDPRAAQKAYRQRFPQV